MEGPGQTVGQADAGIVGITGDGERRARRPREPIHQRQVCVSQPINIISPTGLQPSPPEDAAQSSAQLFNGVCNHRRRPCQPRVLVEIVLEREDRSPDQRIDARESSAAEAQEGGLLGDGQLRNAPPRPKRGAGKPEFNNNPFSKGPRRSKETAAIVQTAPSTFTIINASQESLASDWRFLPYDENDVFGRREKVGPGSKGPVAPNRGGEELPDRC